MHLMMRMAAAVLLERWRRHEREYGVKREGADQGQAVDVAEMHFPAEEKKCAEQNEEEDWPGEVAVVHQVLVHAREWVEHRECLGSGRRGSQFLCNNRKGWRLR